MRRYIILMIATLLAAVAGYAQGKDFHDALRYGQMNEQGVWSVGVGIAPASTMTHTASDLYGGHRVGSTAMMGLALEGGYFVVDNLKLKLTFSWMDDSWSNIMRMASSDAWTSTSQYRVGMSTHIHLGRFDFGAGFFVGGTTLSYNAANVEGGGVNKTPFLGDSFRDHRAMGGLIYEAGVMISPFFRVAGFVEPAVTFKGGDFCSNAGLRLVIFLPFINSVVCK